MFTFLYYIFNRNNMYQILSESVGFCRKYDRKHFGVCFFSSQCTYYILYQLLWYCDIPMCCSASGESGSPSGWIDYFGQAIRTSVNYLPTQVSEVLTQSRDYAVAKLPISGIRNMCAIATYVYLHTVI